MNTQEFKKQLLRKLADMQAHQISQGEIAIERNAEMMDEIQRTSEREIALTALSRDWKTTTAVKGALARIADGSFGVCVACDEPINERRLNAIPWAENCIACQQKAEQQAASMGAEAELAEAA